MRRFVDCPKHIVRNRLPHPVDGRLLPRGSPGDRAIDILARNPPVAPGASDLQRIQSVLLQRLPHRGREPSFQPIVPLRKPGPRSAKRRCISPRLGSRLRLLGSCFCRSTFPIDPPEYRARLGFRVSIEQYLRQHPGGRRSDLLRDLIGLDFDERIVFGDRIADVFQPGANDRLRAFLLIWNDDVDHVRTPPTGRSQP